MNTTTDTQEGKAPQSWPGVFENPNDGYHIHVILNERTTSIISGNVDPQALAPPGTPVLAGMTVSEDCVILRWKMDRPLRSMSPIQPPLEA